MSLFWAGFFAGIGAITVVVLLCITIGEAGRKKGADYYEETVREIQDILDS